MSSPLHTPWEYPASGALPWALVAHLWRAHGWGPVHSLRSLGGGWIHRVYLVNEEYVLRFRPPERSGESLLTEQTLSRLLEGRAPVPQIVLADTSRTLVNADYVVLRRLPGEPLARVWLREESHARRRELVRQWVGLLRTIHEVRLPACGGFHGGELVPAASWRAYLGGRIERRLSRVRACPGADTVLLDAIAATWRRHAAALELAEPCLVHRDLHFGNVLVEGDRITGVIDFEAAVAAPADYELDQIGRFLRWPTLFLEPELGARATRDRCAEVWSLLREGYPALAQVPDLRSRLVVYALEYELACLYDAYRGRWGAAGVPAVTARIERALAGEVLPAGWR